MVDLYKEIDFTEELGNVPELESYLKTKAKEVQEELPSDYIKKPFLDRSFDEFLIGNFESMIYLAYCLIST